MRTLSRALAVLVLASFASPTLAQDTIIFSSDRPVPGLTASPWIFRMSLDGGSMEPLPPAWSSAPVGEYAPTVSPDRQWIAFVAGGSVWKMRVDGTELTWITDGAQIHTTAWSADGAHIYYSAAGTCAEDVNIIAADGSGGATKAVDAGVDFPESVAARISVSVHDEIAVIGGNCGANTGNLYVKKLGETPARLLVSSVNLASWSPDGERLVLTRRLPGDVSQVWIVNRDGSGLAQLTFLSGLFTATDPSWAPDGSRIMFTRFDYAVYPTHSTGAHLFVMDPVPGAEAEQITWGDHVFDQFATWIHLNTPPVAGAGTNRTLECAAANGTPVTLDGTASVDADGDILTYTWTGPFPEGGGTMTGVSPTVTLPLGSSTVQLVVNDGHGDSAPASVAITVAVQVIGFEAPLGMLMPEGSPVQLPDKAFKQGRTLPLKIATRCGGTPVCGDGSTPPRIVGLVRSGQALDIDTMDLDAGEANDGGFEFRPADGHWVFNLTTADLPTGTYAITVQMMDKSKWVGGFVLR